MKEIERTTANARFCVILACICARLICIHIFSFCSTHTRIIKFSCPTFSPKILPCEMAGGLSCFSL